MTSHTRPEGSSSSGSTDFSYYDSQGKKFRWVGSRLIFSRSSRLESCDPLAGFLRALDNPLSPALHGLCATLDEIEWFAVKPPSQLPDLSLGGVPHRAVCRVCCMYPDILPVPQNPG